MRPLPDPYACPDCRGALRLDPPVYRCVACAGAFGDGEGLPRLLREDRLGLPDRRMRGWFYDRAPALHDPFTAVMMPLLQEGRGVGPVRREIRGALALESVRVRSGGAAPRLLEVGVGTGANLPGLREGLAGRPAELYGVDLSLGMLRRARARRVEGGVNLAQADAHRLPFATGSFDRVLHVGALNGMADPTAALEEMCRVTRPGGRVVVVDEQLDPHRRHGLLVRALFRAVTFYDEHPRSPTSLPVDAVHAESRQLGPAFYLLSFERR